MLLVQNNFSLFLHIFCFISFHSGRGECCHLALVATSYKMQHPKEKKIFYFLLENWSQIFRGQELNHACQITNPCRHTQPQPCSTYTWSPAKAGLRNRHTLLIPPFISPLYFSLLFLPTEQKHSSGASFPPCDSHFHVLLCTMSNLKTWQWTLTPTCNDHTAQKLGRTSLPEEVSVCKGALGEKALPDTL